MLIDTLSKMLCKEALVWRQLSHPYVLSFVGIDQETFEKTEMLGMVSPWMTNGTIMNYVKSDIYVASRDRHRLVSTLLYTQGRHRLLMSFSLVP